MEQNNKRQFIYPLPIYQLINLQKLPIQKDNHSINSTENMEKSRIKDYYKLFKDKKNLIENYQKMYNRIILLKKQQDKQLKRKLIQEKKSMYLNKYKPIQNEIIFNKSNYSSDKMTKKKSSNHFLLHQEFQQISKKKADYIKKQRENHESNYYFSQKQSNNEKESNSKENQRLHNKLKDRKQRQKYLIYNIKENVQKFFMEKQHHISQLIQQKIIKQQKQYKQVERKLERLQKIEKQALLKDKTISALNQLKLNKILI